MNNVLVSSQRSKKYRQNYCTVENCGSRSDKDVNLSLIPFREPTNVLFIERTFLAKWEKSTKSESLRKSNESQIGMYLITKVCYSQVILKRSTYYNILPGK